MKKIVSLTLSTLIVSLMATGSVFCREGKNQKQPPHQRKTVLIIDNRNAKELGVLIKPEFIDDRTIREEERVHDYRIGEWITARIPERTTIKLELPQEEIGHSVDFFSVTGETNPFTPIGRCYNLKMGRNYILRFTDNPLGTDCISEEVRDPIPDTQGRTIKIPYHRSNPHTVNDPIFAPDRPSQDTSPPFPFPKNE